MDLCEERGCPDGLELKIVKGGIEFEPDMSISGSFSGSGVDWFQAEASGQVTFTMEYLVSFEKAVKFDKEVKVVEFSRPFSFLVGWIPVFGNATVRLFLGYQAEAEGKVGVTTGAATRYRADVGVRFDNGQWQTLGHTELSYDLMEPIWEAHGSAKARVYARPESTVSLYAVVGGTLGLEPYLRADGAIDLQSGWMLDLYGGMDGIVGFDVGFLDQTLYSYSNRRNLFEKQIRHWEQVFPWGNLEVSLDVEGGKPASDNFVLTLDGVLLGDVEPGETALFQAIAQGEHTLTLEGVSSNCRVQDGRGRRIMVEPGGVGAKVQYAVLCDPPQPDLTVGDVSGASAAQGATMPVSAVVRNGGQAVAGASELQFLLATHPGLDGQKYMLCLQAIAAMPAGYQLKVNTVCRVPDAIPDDNYYLLAIADSKGAVSEQVEENNFGASQGPYAIAKGQASSILLSATSASFSVERGAAIPEAKSIDVTSSSEAIQGLQAEILYQNGSGWLNATLGETSTPTALRIRPATSDLSPGPYSAVITVSAPGGLANSTSVTLNVLEGTQQQIPDYALTAVSGSNAQVGGTIQLGASAAELNGVNAGTPVTRFYLSKTTNLGSAPYPICDHAALASFTVSCTVPSGVPAGTYYVVGNINPDGAITEGELGNNVKASSQTYTISPPAPQIPDYALTAVSGSNAQVGGTIQLGASAAELNGVNAGTPVTRFYLSKTTNLGSAPYPICDHAALASFTVSCTVPSGVPAGTYYVVGNINPDGAITEGELGNNVKASSQTYTISPPAPDPPFTDPDPASNIAATSFTANGKVNPHGLSTTAWFEISTTSYVSGVFDSSSQQSVGSGSSSKAISASFTNLNPDTKYWYRVVAASSAGTSSSSFQSVTTLQDQSGKKADLVITDVHPISSSVNRGSSAKFSVTVKNVGDWVAEQSFTIDLYLSSNTSLGGDTKLCSVSIAARLNTNTIETQQPYCFIPSSVAVGSYYVLAQADPSNQVPEKSESNNLGVGSIKVTVR